MNVTLHRSSVVLAPIQSCAGWGGEEEEEAITWHVTNQAMWDNGENNDFYC